MNCYLFIYNNYYIKMVNTLTCLEGVAYYTNEVEVTRRHDVEKISSQ